MKILAPYTAIYFPHICDPTNPATEKILKFQIKSEQNKFMLAHFYILFAIVSFKFKQVIEELWIKSDL